MELINHQILHGDPGICLQAPVKVVPDDPGLIEGAGRVQGAPYTLAGDSPGIDIQQYILPAEAKPVLRVPGTVRPVGVLKFLDIQIEDHHGIDIADPVAVRERQDSVGFPFGPVEEQQLHAGGSFGPDGKIHAVGEDGGAVDFIYARTDIETVDVIQRKQIDVGQRICGRSVFFCGHDFSLTC